MGKATLVIMAAGIGSRFGGGIKQLEGIGPNGEIIMDYSIYDAIEAGFDKVVFVIRKELEKDFREIIGNRIEKKVNVSYAFQETSDIPEAYGSKFTQRTKPWGTGQAILACKGIVKEPFLVINADDYYGKQAYKEAFLELTTEKEKQDKMEISMVGFVLGNTLSENGGVTRGICKVDPTGWLTEVVETKDILRTEQGKVEGNGSGEEIKETDIVSMNMWGLSPEFIEILEKGFQEFLSQLDPEDMKSEYLLPSIIGNLLENNQIVVKVLKSIDQWFGVTYREDKESVVKSIQQLIQQGVYAETLV